MGTLHDDKSAPTTPTMKKKKTKKHRGSATWSDLWHKTSVAAKPLKNAVYAMQVQIPSLSRSNTKTPSFDLYKSTTPPSVSAFPKEDKFEPVICNLSDDVDRTLLLNDDILLQILSLLPDSQRNSNCLVCKRWLNLQGRLIRSLKVLDWEFIESGRFISRFPNLTQVDLINSCVGVVAPLDSGICLNNRLISAHLDSGVSGVLLRACEGSLLPVEIVDGGLKVLANGCPNLRRLAVINASELGLLTVAEECPTLQELELHRCNDNTLRGIAACSNLQILKLVGNVYGLYGSLVSDVGLTILAQGCKRLVKLELGGCEGSFDGIKAIGQCCQMLEELTICDHRMNQGWLAALPFCENLKALRLVSCKRIDTVTGLDEVVLGCCSALERLHLDKCQLRDKNGVGGLFKVCGNVREVVVRDCWGFDDEVFSLASTCRRVELLYLEGCSLLTTQGIETVLLSWNELQNLKIESCKNIKYGEISPELSTLFSSLKDLRWRSDSKSLLVAGLVGSGLGKKGRKFFRKSIMQ
ncbi:F-box protein At5g07670 [Linum perenne]